MKDGKLNDFQAEPLVRLSDLDEYRAGLARHLRGEWDDQRWTAFRVRFGVYGQKQPGVQMVRVKVPGGIVPVSWLKTLAKVNRDYCQGDAHITTRQDFQLYFIPLDRTDGFLEELYQNGMTTREACGNTLRNMTACALSGICPREHVDAGQVADRLSRALLRNPLVQHMPRKVKISVSGCETDCGVSAIHDLAFIATDHNGSKGFRVLAGGGLGANPRAAVTVMDFATEEQLPAVVETLARLHQRYSDRVNRNAARIKFVVKRFGEEKFRALFAEEFARVSALPQREWEGLQWRRPSEVPVARTPRGIVESHDGSLALVAAPPLGLLSSDQLDGLAEIAEQAGVTQVRTTRDQNIVLVGVAREKAAEVKARLDAIGLPVPEQESEAPDVVSCPGTTTCRIGITNSQTLGLKLHEMALGDARSSSVAVRVSGCQNSCGLHHVGDFGLHGMAKKVKGQPVPHYQIHVGGDSRQSGAIGLTGPVIPSKLAPQAVVMLKDAYFAGRSESESVRDWAVRLGKKQLAEILTPLESQLAEDMEIDWGDTESFAGAPIAKSECAASFALDEVLADLADDALLVADRSLHAGLWAEALKSFEEAIAQAGKRVLHQAGQTPLDSESNAVVIERVRAAFPQYRSLLDDIEAERMAALGDGRAHGYREQVALWIDTMRAALEAPAPKDEPMNLAGLEDFDVSVFQGAAE